MGWPWTCSLRKQHWGLRSDKLSRQLQGRANVKQVAEQIARVASPLASLQLVPQRKIASVMFTWYDWLIRTNKCYITEHVIPQYNYKRYQIARTRESECMARIKIRKQLSVHDFKDITASKLQKKNLNYTRKNPTVELYTTVPTDVTVVTIAISVTSVVVTLSILWQRCT